MPRGDRTGPKGLGSRTGRASGYCAGYGAPGYANPMPGSGFGMGLGAGRGGLNRGGGRGRRNMFHATGLFGWQRFGGYAVPYGYPVGYQGPDPVPEKQALKNQAAALESELAAIKKRLTEMEPGSSEE
jgi:hypothetical protein